MAASVQRRRPDRPLGVTILAVWEVLVGIQLLAYGFTAVSLSDTFEQGSPVRVLVFLIGLGSTILGISALILARGYVLGFESARRRGRSVAVIAILLAVFGVLFLPVRLAPESPFWTIIGNVVIFAYLGSKKVVAFFRAGSRK